ncbi:MAG: ATPase domain-containing protein [Deltaproteobacteria bacterium]|nr:ATPase domain-containing protein [Myxococcales bacterium]MDP3215406.1 ATPase domain-containing protein [Deltaproteobacteria bacterium]
MSQRVQIKKLPTGVPGLDDVLGGGLPEFSFNLIAGPPGGGKTTLAHQIMFANASPERPALFVMICGEPPLKMLRYQQQFSFFDPALIPGSIRFLHLGAELITDGLEKVLERIIQEVEATGPRLVFVDSFRAMTRRAVGQGGLDIQQFVERLSLHLTSWEATTFLVGEYDDDNESNPIFTVADGIVRLVQSAEHNSIVRKVQVVKMRGQGQIPGLHTLKISEAGLRVYPRLPSPDAPHARPALSVERKKTGIAGLDEMLGGGIPAGYSTMIVGPSGSGKTIAATQFIREGIERGEAGVIAVFEKRPDEYLSNGPDASLLQGLVDEGKLEMLYLRPLDLSVDETMEELAAAVKRVGAKRLVIDSLSGLELALAPSFREDFRESLYRMVGALLRLGVTVVMTAELVESYVELRLSPHGISFLTDVIVLQRYVEIQGELRRFMVIAKMRGQAHDTRLRFYEIGPGGIVIGEATTGFQGLLVGNPRAISDAGGGAR